MEKRIKKSNAPKMIIGILAVAFIVAGGVFLYKTAYENGKKDGRKNYETETTEFIQNLAKAISEKSHDFAEIQTNLSKLPDEINAETIDAYLETLGKIELQNEEAKNSLKSYADSWQAMKTTYSTGDNDKIKSEFETLKSSATEIAEKLQNLYNENIKSALEKL